MKWLVVYPILIPLITAIVVLFSSRRTTAQRFITLLGCSVHVIFSFILLFAVMNVHYVIMQAGHWPAPFGITLIADLFSALMVTTASIVGFCVALFTVADINKSKVRGGYYPAFCILLTGVSAALLTGDLFNLYVWFEVILIASFVLLSLGENHLQLEGAVKYTVLNLIATLTLLTAIAFLYGITGTLNLADLANFLSHSESSELATTIAVVFLVSFGIKAALFPLFFWLPASYPTTSFSASAVFSGLLSKVGVYALIRLFTLLFLRNPHYLHTLLLFAANFSLIIGILGAIAQVELRRLLSFTLISHIGYMIVGLAIATPLGLLASIFYMIQHMLVKSNLFLSSGYIHFIENDTRLTGVRDLYKKAPYFSVLFFISACALAGVPPFSGFWGKLLLIESALSTHFYSTAALLALVGLLTLFVLFRGWQNMFLRNDATEAIHSDSIVTPTRRFFLLTPIIILTTCILFLGLVPNVLYHLADGASNQLLHPENYVQAVLTRHLPNDIIFD